MACIRHLRRLLPACKISVEVEKPNREGLVELAAEADVVFYSKSWAEVRDEPWPHPSDKKIADGGRAAVTARLRRAFDARHPRRRESERI